MVDDFQVSSFESHTRILRNIGTRFGVPFVTVYSQDAKQQIEDLCDVYQGQILLATSSPTTRPRPYSPYGFKLYHGEEAAYVHASMPKKPWTELSEVEKKKHIASIGANKPEIMNTLRITEPYGAVLVELDRLKEANSQQLAVTYSLGASGDKIDQYWGLPFMLWLPEEMEPQSSMIDYQWNPRMLAALAIIAKATLGQGQIITDIIKKIAGGRGVLTEHDVLRAITHIYKKAGLITSKITEEKKEHEKRRQAARKAEAKSKKEAEAADALGEEAAEAAYPKGRKTGQGRQGVDELAEQLGKTRTSRPAA